MRSDQIKMYTLINENRCNLTGNSKTHIHTLKKNMKALVACKEISLEVNPVKIKHVVMS
jgi:hypothetical protein